MPQPLLRDVPRVALVIETTRAYGRRILEGVAQYTRENGPWLIHAAPRALHDPLQPWLADWNGDGIICRVEDPEDARILADTGLPMVNLKATSETCLGPARAVNDHEAIGRMAAEHLLKRGFRNFAFLGVPGHGWSDLRCRGFAAAAEAEGCRAGQYAWGNTDLTTWQDGDLAEDIDAIAQWLGDLRKPLGVMAADDFLGVQLLNGCRRCHISVPEEIGVIGVDNDTTVCRLGLPPLSSVEPGCNRLGYEAARLLDGLMQGHPLPDEPIMVPPRTVATRQSTNVTAVGDPLVARSMAFIREHACDGINVADVLEFALVSRTTLQDHFRQALDTPVYQVIVETRLARAKELLTHSNLPLKSIATRAGFRHPEHLHEVFRRHEHMTPGDYRKTTRPTAVG